MSNIITKRRTVNDNDTHEACNTLSVKRLLNYNKSVTCPRCDFSFSLFGYNLYAFVKASHNKRIHLLNSNNTLRSNLNLLSHNVKRTNLGNIFLITYSYLNYKPQQNNQQIIICHLPQTIITL